VELEVQ